MVRAIGIMEELERIRGLNIPGFEGVDPTEDFLRSCYVGSIQLVMHLYSRELDDNTVGWGMRYACSKGHLEVAKFLWYEDERVTNKIIDIDDCQIFAYTTLSIKQWLLVETEIPNSHIAKSFLQLGPGIWLGSEDAEDHQEQFNWLWDTYGYLLTQENLHCLYNNMFKIGWFHEASLVGERIEE